MMFGRLLKLQILVLLLLAPLAVSAANHAVLYVVDSSGSMWSKVENTEKVYMARNVLSAAISKLPSNIDVGLMAYGHRKKGDCGDFELLAPPGSPRASMIKKIASFTPKGMTPLSGTIDLAINQLKSRGGKGTVVFLSDGAESCKRDPCKAALGAGEDIRIHVVGFGVKSYDISQLNCVAKNGGGKYFSANSESSLSAAFASVAREIANDDQGSVATAAASVVAANTAVTSTVAAGTVAVNTGSANAAAAKKAAAEKAAAEKAAAEKAAEKAATEKAATDKAAAEKAAAKAEVDRIIAEQTAAAKAEADRLAAEQAVAAKAEMARIAAEKAAAKAEVDRVIAAQAAAAKAEADRIAAEKVAAAKAEADRIAAEKEAAGKAERARVAASKAAAAKAEADRVAAFDDDDSWGRDVVQNKPGIIYSDDFNSGYLSEHWQVVNPVSALLHNDNGNLILMTKKSSLAKGTVPNLLVLNHESVRGDYSVTIKMSSEFSTGKVGTTKQEAGLLFYRKNRELLGLVVSNENLSTFPKCRNKDCRQVVRVDLIKVLDGSRTRVGIPFRVAWQPPGSTSMTTGFTVYLKINKTGFEYTASASLDGKQWYGVGKVPLYGSDLNPTIFASSNSNYPYALVKFDDIIVRRGED